MQAGLRRLSLHVKRLATRVLARRHRSKSQSVHKDYPINYTVHYLTSETDVDNALRSIKTGPVGFDTEFVPRKPTDLDVYLDDLFSHTAGNKKSVILALHALELDAEDGYTPDWDHTSLCVVQIARDDDVWLLNMNRIRAVPSELRRILVSIDIAKVGVGLNSDVPVIWHDLGLDVNNFVDCGLMTRLLLTDKYIDSPFNFLAMKNAVQDVLRLQVSKDLQKSNWKGDAEGHLSEEQQKYAAIDAHASLKLYEHLQPALEAKARTLQRNIPAGWYTFNGRYGEPVRQAKTHSDRWVPWTPAVCTWFFNGRFQGYQF